MDIWVIAFNHVSGIPKLDVPPTLQPCHGCSLGKATEWPFPPSTTRGDQPLGLVHTNLCAFPVQSRTKHIWMMTFLDDFSGYGSIVCLKCKSDTVTRFPQLICLGRESLWTQTVETMFGPWRGIHKF